jgi:hypothetical protein
MPPAVNAPVAMMLSGAVGAGDVVMSWKCSNPELPAPAAGLALAAVRPAAATAPATATTLIPARILLLSFIMVHPSHLTGSYLILGHRRPSGQHPAARARRDRTRVPHYDGGATMGLAPLRV